MQNRKKPQWSMSWDWFARLDSRIAPPNCTRVVLDSLVSIRYNKHIKGVAIKTAPPYEQLNSF